VLAACSGNVTTDASNATVVDYPDASARMLTRMANEPRPVENSAIPPRHLDEEQFPESLLERTRIVWGGAAPDGIAALEDPAFVPADSIDWLEDQEAVLTLRVGDDVRAYPVQIMTWHEIVNHTIGDIPVTVTYCPLCNSAVAFDRRADDRILDFGTSGSLHRSALVLYDRQTESLWTQFDGLAVIGDLIGTQLEQLTVQTVSWAEFREAHPTGAVLDRDTGHDRPYGENPYGALDTRTDPLNGWFTEEVDGRFNSYDRLVGFAAGDTAVAVPLEPLSRTGVATTDLDGRPISVWHRPGTASPLNNVSVAAGAEIGATGVFFSDLDGDELHFERTPAGFVDAETGSTWNLLGEAVAGTFAGSRLEPVPHLDTFWFAWSTEHPDTRIVD
jgi:hypothetical protein